MISDYTSEVLNETKILSLDNFCLSGELAKRLCKNYKRLVQLKQLLFTDKIIEKYGVAEFSGNWLESMGLFAKHYKNEAIDHLQEIADQLILNQKPYGGFASCGDPQSMSVGFWIGDMRAVGGILGAWESTGRKEYLDSVLNLADGIIKYWPGDLRNVKLPGGNSYNSNPLKVEMYFTIILPGILKLYNVTCDEKYLQFAKKIIEQFPRLTATTIPEHADGRMFCILGLLELYDLTRDQKYLEWAKNDHEIIADSFQWASGGIPEIFPDNWRDEGCQTANWLNVNLRLWNLTGAVKYPKLAEIIWLNHIYFSQHVNGGFCWGQTLRNGGDVFQQARGLNEPFEMYYCCTETVPRSLLELGKNILCVTNGVPFVCFWSKGLYKLNEIQIEICDDLVPFSPVRLVCSTANSIELKMRIPVNMRIKNIKVNSQKAIFQTSDEWIYLKFSEKGEYNIIVEFEGIYKSKIKKYPSLRPLSGDVNNPDANWHIAENHNYDDERTACFWGPWMLKSDVNETEWFQPNRKYKNYIKL